LSPRHTLVVASDQIDEPSTNVGAIEVRPEKRDQPFHVEPIFGAKKAYREEHQILGGERPRRPSLGRRPADALTGSRLEREARKEGVDAIVATARHHGAMLVTKDDRIRRYEHVDSAW
jgi:hypothetical protein